MRDDSAMPSPGAVEPAIETVLAECLAIQRARLAPRTFRDYAAVVEFLQDSLNSYAYKDLDKMERRRWETAFEDGDHAAFCQLFGPEKIVEHLGAFLGYFMIRKVVAGEELLRSAGTVTRKLVEWLQAQQYVDAASAEDAISLWCPTKAPLSTMGCLT